MFLYTIAGVLHKCLRVSLSACTVRGEKNCENRNKIMFFSPPSSPRQQDPWPPRVVGGVLVQPLAINSEAF